MSGALIVADHGVFLHTDDEVSKVLFNVEVGDDVQALGSAPGFDDWYEAKVVELRKDRHCQMKALVNFGSDHENDGEVHLEWFAKADWCINKLLNR